ncbi:hypothetical protein EYC84_011628 [Monilinia fructicola]|uniref:Uncharacterized protein n=1 Tax=Monilinia fructicola TaxID=38448 RepID=A0A5M9J5P9_MONFR|nr:hypothetical protein EYC84_011628 [Monilinia fructicola]
MARSNGVSDRLRNEESWVEISSQPSSSSISSIDNEIVTTGLRVSQHPSTRRRRRSQNQPRPQVTPNNHRQTSTSSQEEYEESESEPDHIDILTSSNEISPPVAIPARLSTRETYDAESEDDEDENGTALGPQNSPLLRRRRTRTPQKLPHKIPPPTTPSVSASSPNLNSPPQHPPIPSPDPHPPPAHGAQICNPLTNNPSPAKPSQKQTKYPCGAQEEKGRAAHGERNVHLPNATHVGDERGRRGSSLGRGIWSRLCYWEGGGETGNVGPGRVECFGSGYGGCGREVVRGGGGGLKRFRWGGSVARSIVAS